MGGVITSLNEVYAALLTIGACGTVMAGSTIAEEVLDSVGAENVPIDPAGFDAGATAGIIVVLTHGGSIGY